MPPLRIVHFSGQVFTAGFERGLGTISPAKLTFDASNWATPQTVEVAVLDDRRSESRLGKDHHARGGLDQVRARARADDEEEGQGSPTDCRSPPLYAVRCA